MDEIDSDEDGSSARARQAFSDSAPDSRRELDRVASERDTDGLITHPELQYDFGIEDRCAHSRAQMCCSARVKCVV